MSAQSKEESVQHVFEKIYDNYDSMNSIISSKRHVSWTKDVMKRMKVQQNSHGSDVRTARAGRALSLANEVGTNGKVIGLDFSKNMLKVAQEKKEQSQLEQLEFIHGNAMDLPFPDNTFDYVTIGFGLR